MRFLLSWALFGLGDLIARVMRLWNFAGHLYPVYNRLMLTSCDVQGPGRGPWRNRPDE